MTGCEGNGSGPIGGGGDDPEITGITYVKGEATAVAVAEDSTIEIDYNETLTFTASVTDADTFLWAYSTTNIVTITNPSSLTATIRGAAEGETEITFTARNGDLTATFKFKIKVGPRPAEGLYLDVFKNDVMITDGDNFEMTTEDSGVVFTAEAIEDEVDVSSTVTWAAAPAGIVTITPNTGGNVTITPVSNGTVTITVTAPSVKYEDEVVEFTIEIKKGIGPNVLFQWNAIDEPWAAKNSGAPGTPSTWTPASAEQFKLQDNGKRVQTVQLYRNQTGANVSFDKDGDNDGFILGAAGAGTQRIFTIGQSLHVRTEEADTSLTNLGGEIDLLRKRVRLTIGYANIKQDADRNILQILINNNGHQAALSMYGTSSVMRTYNRTTQVLTATNTANVREQITYDSATGTGTVALIIDTRNIADDTTGFGSAFNGHDFESALENSFISLYSQSGGTAGVDNFITITSILLEYIDSDTAPETVGLDVKESGANLPAGGITLVKPETATKTLSAITTPAADSISWAVTNETIATVSSATGNSVTITAGNNGTTTLTVTARKAGLITNVKRFDITVSGEEQQIVPELMFVRQANSGTGTDAMPTINADNKFIINNTVTNQGFQTGGFSQGTFVYLNTPLGNTASISARVRITQRADAEGNNGRGLIIGFINEPRATGGTTVVAADGIRINGIRVSTLAEVSAYTTRGDGAGTAFTNGNQSFPSVINSASGALFDDEYILIVSRTGATAYTFTVQDKDGKEITTMNRNGIAQVSNLGDSYAGFMIAGATVEISQITVTGSPLITPFTTPASTPAVYLPTGVTFTAPATGITGTFPNFIYTHVDGNLALTAAAVPARAPQNISWAITSGDADFESGGKAATGLNTTLVFGPTADTVVVTATATGTSIVATLTITVLGDVPVLDDITISSAYNRNTVMAGNGSSITGFNLRFAAAFDPPAAEETIKWVVRASDDYEDETAVTAASIANTGLLTASNAGVASVTTVYVFAATLNDGVVSNGIPVTVRPFNQVIFSWNASEHEAAPYTSGSNWKGVPVFTHNATVASNTAGLSMPVNGRFLLGLINNPGNTANNLTHLGALDFSKTFRITITYTGWSRNGNFQIYMNNISTGATGNSVIRWHTSNAVVGAGGTSNLSPLQLAAAAEAIGEVALTINPATNLAISSEAVTAGYVKEDVISNAFLLFRCDGNGSLTITNIHIEYVVP
jgi:hypothetical protein